MSKSATAQATIIDRIGEVPIVRMMNESGWMIRAMKNDNDNGQIMLYFSKRIPVDENYYSEDQAFRLKLAFPYDPDFPDNQANELSLDRSHQELETIFQSMKTDHVFSAGSLFESLKGDGEIGYGHFKPHGIEVSISFNAVSCEAYREMSVEEALDKLTLAATCIEDNFHDILYNDLNDFIVNQDENNVLVDK